MALLGAVLAGGESRRFGSDKAVALLHGRPLIAHAIDALAAEADAVIVCGKEWGDWVPDRPAPGLGPLGGINAALHCAAARGYEKVLTIPCDVPALPANLIDRLATIGPATWLTEMPVIGLWLTALAPQLDAWLATSDDRAVRGWGRSVGGAALELGEPLANLNTPEALNKFVSDYPGG